MRHLVGCEDGNCPKVKEDGDYLVFQGDTVPAEELGGLPDGESAVRIPRALVIELLEQVAPR